MSESLVDKVEQPSAAIIEDNPVLPEVPAQRHAQEDLIADLVSATKENIVDEGREKSIEPIIDEPAPAKAEHALDQDQEEGETFSVKYITQLTTSTGSIEEDKCEEPSPILPEAKQATVPYSSEGDVGDFVQLDKPLGKVEEEEEVMRDHLFTNRPEESSPKRATMSEESSTVASAPKEYLSSGGQDESGLPHQQQPLIEFKYEPESLGSYSQMGTVPDVPTEMEMPSAPLLFDKPEPLKTVQVNKIGGDNLISYSDEEPETYIGHRSMESGFVSGKFVPLEREKRDVVQTTPSAEKSVHQVDNRRDKLEDSISEVPCGRVVGKPVEDFVSPWISGSGVDKKLLRLIYWENPLASGLCFAFVLSFLIGLCYFTLVSIVSYVALIFMAVGLVLHAFERFKFLGNDESATAKLHEMFNCNLPKKKIHAQVDVFLEGVTYLSDSTKSAVTGHPRELFRIMAVMLCFYLFGSVFTLLHLTIVGVLLVFSVPVLLKRYEKELDQLVEKTKSHLKPLAKTIGDKVPFVDHYLKEHDLLKSKTN